VVNTYRVHIKSPFGIDERILAFGWVRVLLYASLVVSQLLTCKSEDRRA